jgi:hypothetical protein
MTTRPLPIEEFTDSSMHTDPIPGPEEKSEYKIVVQTLAVLVKDPKYFSIQEESYLWELQWQMLKKILLKL